MISMKNAKDNWQKIKKHIHMTFSESDLYFAIHDIEMKVEVKKQMDFRCKNTW